MICLCGRIYKDKFIDTDYTNQDDLNNAISWLAEVTFLLACTCCELIRCMCSFLSVSLVYECCLSLSFVVLVIWLMFFSTFGVQYMRRWMNGYLGGEWMDGGMDG